MFVENSNNFPEVLPPDVIVQQKIEGKEFTCDFLISRTGEVKGLVPRYRLETKAGISTKGKTFSSPVLEKIVQKIADVLLYRGVGNLQGFLLPNQDVVTMEINPRFSGGLPLSLALDPYFVEKYILEVLELNSEHLPPPEEKVMIMSRYYSNIITSN